MDNRSIGEKISSLRERQGLTTMQLAEKVGVSQAQISRLENGKQGFRTVTLVKIATALSVNPGYFFLENGADNHRLSPMVETALGQPEFAEFVERVAGSYLDDPSILPALSRLLDE